MDEESLAELPMYTLFHITNSMDMYYDIHPKILHNNK